tara:strand:+ start:802 stop:1119 length:318 start_codon:yes stop_codon:yes gene_type:complete
MILNIGRNKKNEIILNELKVSNFHAQLLMDENGDIFLNDLQSENGTSVNGEIITESTQLKTNDVVKIAGIPFNWKMHIPKKKEITPEPDKQKRRKSFFKLFKSKK